MLFRSKDYASEVSSYTKGLGIFMVKPCGYQITKDGYSSSFQKPTVVFEEDDVINSGGTSGGGFGESGQLHRESCESHRERSTAVSAGAMGKGARVIST